MIKGCAFKAATEFWVGCSFMCTRSRLSESVRSSISMFFSIFSDSLQLWPSKLACTIPNSRYREQATRLIPMQYDTKIGFAHRRVSSDVLVHLFFGRWLFGRVLTSWKSRWIIWFYESLQKLVSTSNEQLGTINIVIIFFQILDVVYSKVLNQIGKEKGLIRQKRRSPVCKKVCIFGSLPDCLIAFRLFTYVLEWCPASSFSTDWKLG